MPIEVDDDVPSPIDLRTMQDATQWAAEVSAKRPWRPNFFEAFTRELRTLPDGVGSLLELGSGPGFLAQHLLTNLEIGRYIALDFSDAMHSLARERLGETANAVEFITRDFRAPEWMGGLPRVSAVVTLQAVHELRHKRRAAALYSQVASLLEPGGVFLMCDHYCGVGGMTNEALFMSEPEHVEALTRAGFAGVACVHKEGGMVLYRGETA
jgi:SAM-dependent methyltransferase